MKKNKISNKELIKEAREEGMFKEARDFTHNKKKYVAASNKDNVMIYLWLIIAVLIFAGINRFFNV